MADVVARFSSFPTATVRPAVVHAGIVRQPQPPRLSGGRRHCTVGRPAFTGRDKRAERRRARAPVRLETGRLIADARRYATRGVPEHLDDAVLRRRWDEGNARTGFDEWAKNRLAALLSVVVL